MNLPNHDKSGRSLFFSKGLVSGCELLHLQNRLKHVLNCPVSEIVLKNIVAQLASARVDHCVARAVADAVILQPAPGWFVSQRPEFVGVSIAHIEELAPPIADEVLRPAVDALQAGVGVPAVTAAASEITSS